MLYFWIPIPAGQTRQFRILIIGYVVIIVAFILEVTALCIPDWIYESNGSAVYGILPYPSQFSSHAWAVAGCWLMYTATALSFVIFWTYIALIGSVRNHGWSPRLYKFYYAISLTSVITSTLTFSAYMLFAIDVTSFGDQFRVGFSAYISLVAAISHAVSCAVFLVIVKRFSFV